MAEKNNPLSYFKHLANNTSYEVLKNHTLNDQLEKFPKDFINPDFEKGTFESIHVDIDQKTGEIVQGVGKFDFRKNFESKLLKEKSKAKKEIESMLMGILVNGGNQKAIGFILLDELEKIINVAAGKYSESPKFAEILKDLSGFVCSKFEIIVNKPKKVIQFESFDSIFKPREFVTSSMIEEIYDLAVNQDIIYDGEITFEMFFNSLTQRNTSEKDYIKFDCKNSVIKAFLESIKHLFKQMNGANIEKSRVFTTKQGTFLTQTNYNRTIHDTDLTTELHFKILDIINKS